MSLSQPTPELAVPDVIATQEYYRDILGFDIAWYDAGGGIGAVAHGDCAIFFRHSDAPIHPSTFWIFTPEVDTTHAAMAQRGATITKAPWDTPWGLRQFSLTDAYGNVFHFHCDRDSDAAS